MNYILLYILLQPIKCYIPSYNIINPRVYNEKNFVDKSNIISKANNDESSNNDEINTIIINLERFNSRYNLLHSGISFNNSSNIIRFDFRPYNYKKSYMTTQEQRDDINLLFPDIIINEEKDSQYSQYRNLIFEDRENIFTKDIIWGYTDKTQEEIINYEQDILIERVYRLGIYDCRHYVRDFTKWCIDKPTPVWRLKRLWDEN